HHHLAQGIRRHALAFGNRLCAAGRRTGRRSTGLSRLCAFSRANRELLRRRGIQAVIPERSDQEANRKRRGQRGGRPVGLDTEAYKRRNVVERSFNTFKQWRGLATRYDKLALTYRGGVVLRAITIWLKELGDTP
ncbi:transposase, partial [Arthrobacter sp. Br18]|uniref:transposase n=1 Tax=Arthrobacter sp. Br18 TaxID=1312954 RepID=UPI0012DD268D